MRSVKKSKADLVREAYDRLAPVYDRRWRPYIDATLRAVVEALRCAGQEELLDVACGTGELEKLLLVRWPGLRITGVDLSPSMLERAREKLECSTVSWVVADAASLGLADASFDYVVCASSFHYFSRPRQALREMHRVLRRTGTLVLVDWCDDYLTCKLCGIWLRWTDPAFQRTYSLRTCREMLEQEGFEVREAIRFRTGWIWGLMRFVCWRADR